MSANLNLLFRRVAPSTASAVAFATALLLLTAAPAVALEAHAFSTTFGTKTFNARKPLSALQPHGRRSR